MKIVFNYSGSRNGIPLPVFRSMHSFMLSS